MSKIEVIRVGEMPCQKKIHTDHLQPSLQRAEQPPVLFRTFNPTTLLNNPEYQNVK